MIVGCKLRVFGCRTQQTPRTHPSDLRGGDAADHADCRDQDTRAAIGLDTAPNPTPVHPSTHHADQCPARPSGRVRYCRRGWPQWAGVVLIAKFDAGLSKASGLVREAGYDGSQLARLLEHRGINCSGSNSSCCARTLASTLASQYGHSMIFVLVLAIRPDLNALREEP